MSKDDLHSWHKSKTRRGKSKCDISDGTCCKNYELQDVSLFPDEVWNKLLSCAASGMVYSQRKGDPSSWATVLLGNFCIQNDLRRLCYIPRMKSPWARTEGNCSEGHISEIIHYYRHKRTEWSKLLQINNAWKGNSSCEIAEQCEVIYWYMHGLAMVLLATGYLSAKSCTSLPRHIQIDVTAGTHRHRRAH